MRISFTYEYSCLYALTADAPTISQTYGAVEVYQLLAESRRMAQAKKITWQSQKTYTQAVDKGRMRRSSIRERYTKDVCDEILKYAVR